MPNVLDVLEACSVPPSVYSRGHSRLAADPVHLCTCAFDEMSDCTVLWMKTTTTKNTCRDCKAKMQEELEERRLVGSLEAQGSPVPETRRRQTWLLALFACLG